ncbi:MAG: hypothetical protein NVS3B26_06190 [Mycobacteriales bacterium]
MKTASSRIIRLDYGYFVRPAEETGTGSARVEPVLGYAVLHPRGVLLFDTGMGEHPESARTTAPDESRYPPLLARPG